MKIAAIGLSLVIASILGTAPAKGVDATVKTDAITPSTQASEASEVIRFDAPLDAELMNKQGIVYHNEISFFKGTLNANEVATLDANATKMIKIIK